MEKNKKLLMKALKGASTKEEALETINDYFGEEKEVEVDETETKKETPDKKETEQKEEETKKVDVDYELKFNELNEKLEAMANTNEEKNKQLEKFEAVINKMLDDKPFGIVKKIKKQEPEGNDKALKVLDPSNW